MKKFLVVIFVCGFVPFSALAQDAPSLPGPLPVEQTKVSSYSQLKLELPALFTGDTFGDGTVGTGLNVIYSYLFRVNDKAFVGPAVELGYNYYGSIYTEDGSLSLSSLSVLAGIAFFSGEDIVYFTCISMGRNTSYLSDGSLTVSHGTMGFKFTTGMLFHLSKNFQLGFHIGWLEIGMSNEYPSIVLAGLSTGLKF